MNQNLFLRGEIQSKLFDKHSGRKQFLERNLHYLSHITPNARLINKNLSPMPRLNTKKTYKREIDKLKLMLDIKTSEISRLRKDIQSGRSPIASSRRNDTPMASIKNNFDSFQKAKEDYKHYRSLYNLEIKPSDNKEVVQSPFPIRSQICITRKSPKPLRDDPITGLPRSYLARLSPTTSQRALKPKLI